MKQALAQRSLLLLAFAFLWGLAESLWLFVVADILISYATLRAGWRAGVAAGIAAALGALFGGAWLYRLGASDPAAAIAWLDAVPFVSPGMIAHAADVMASASWPLGMLVGSVTGMPYKLFAAGAGQAGVPLGLFLAASLPIRLARYLAATAAVALADRAVGDRLSERGKLWLLTLFWIVFYGQFWWRVSA